MPVVILFLFKLYLLIHNIFHTQVLCLSIYYQSYYCLLRRSYIIAQADLKLAAILLSQPSKY